MNSKLMHDRTWMLRDASVDELYEYKSLGVIRNYASSYSTNADNKIQLVKKQGCCFQPIFIAAKPVLSCK